MCGIGGWLGHCPDSFAEVSERMVRAMRHRGPDASGIKSWPEAVLVHTRLSIIDRSEAGTQPMCNEDESIWTVFNGEIYNHRELHRDLEGRGHVFKGYSDGEVLPHLYEEYGPDFVTKVRGMFAFAIYDTKRRTLCLGRDRFGIKPLFYASTNHRLAFASEIRALLNLGDIDDRPNSQAISDLAALFYIPAPETFYLGIRALLPGEMLTAEFSGEKISVTQRTFHKWTIAPDFASTLKTVVDETDTLLTAAVQRQVESDVPLGALLSGGIDSSLVSTAAQHALNGTIQTFNVRFPDEAYDETWAALSVAEHIGSHHETLDFHKRGGTWDYVTNLLSHAGQPFADTSLFAVNSLCRLIKEYVTVVLSGDGGDEGFGGYSHYHEVCKIVKLQQFPVSFWHAGVTLLGPLARLGVMPHRFSLQLADLAGADDTAVVQNLFSMLRKDEHGALCAIRDVLPIRRLFEPQWDYQLPKHISRLERLSAHITEINTRLTLPNDFLFKVDTASMRESIEVRVPMLDEKLFDFALSLPHSLKIRDGQSKCVLRELAKRKLPTAVAQKRKMGFAVPVDAWLDAKFRDRLKDFLLGPSSSLADYFRPEVYRPLVNAFCNGTHDQCLTRRESYGRVMMLLSVQLALSSRL